MVADWKSLSLVGAGSVAGIFPLIWELARDQISPIIIGTIGVGIIFSVFILLWYGSGSYSQWKHDRTIRMRRRKSVRIGIFNDISKIRHPEHYVHTNISYSEWEQKLQNLARPLGLRINIEYVSCKSQLDPFIAIINPFGGLYPEEDLKTYSTLIRIINFVKEGGLFINVADIPFYFAYDPTLNRRIDTTDPTTEFVGFVPVTFRSFELSAVSKELGLKPINIIDTVEVNINRFLESTVRYPRVFANRGALVTENMKTHVDEIRTDIGQASPLFSLKYGRGEFLISMIFLDDPQNGDVDSVILKIMSDLTLRRVKSIILDSLDS